MTSLSELGAAGRAAFYVRVLRPFVNEYDWKTPRGETKKAKNFIATIVGEDPEQYAMAVVSGARGNITNAVSRYCAGLGFEISRVQFSPKDQTYIGSPIKRVINLTGTTQRAIQKASPEEKKLALSTCFLQ